jgi:hypothetical protein
VCDEAMEERLNLWIQEITTVPKMKTKSWDVVQW